MIVTREKKIMKMVTKAIKNCDKCPNTELSTLHTFDCSADQDHLQNEGTLPSKVNFCGFNRKENSRAGTFAHEFFYAPYTT